MPRNNRYKYKQIAETFGAFQMSAGRFRNKPLNSIGPNYLVWVLGNADRFHSDEVAAVRMFVEARLALAEPMKIKKPSCSR